MEYSIIRKQRDEDTNKLFSECKVFWAFSNEQFDQNKTPLKDGEKYISIGAGGYMPKGNYQQLIDGMKEIKKTFKKATSEAKIREKHILYELNNHECFYTGNIENATEVLGEGYTSEEVLGVYKKFKAQKYVK